MAFLSGLLGGIGQGAREVANNMLETQMTRYRSAGRIWETLAQDENYHPNIRQQALGFAQKLYGANPMQRGSVQEADKIIKTDPSKWTQEAWKAQKLLGYEPSKYYNEQGYRGGEQRIQMEADSTAANEAAKVQALIQKINSFTGGQAGAGMSPLSQTSMTRRMMGAPIKITHTSGSWIDSKGQQHIDEPIQQTEAGTFDSNGHPIDLSPNTQVKYGPARLIQFGDSLIQVGGDAGLNTLATRSPAATTSTRSMDPVNLTSSTTTLRDPGQVSFANAGGAPGNTPGGFAPPPQMAPQPGTVPQANPPAPGAQPTPNSVRPPSKGGEFPGQYIPSPVELKDAYSGVMPKKLDAAERGNEHVGWILDAVEKFSKEYGTPATGPIRGRIYEFLNTLGWGDAINAVAGKGRELAPLVQQGAITEDQAKVLIAPYEQKLDQIADQVARAGKTLGDENAAQLFAEIITLTRSLNGLELIAMSGSGNGITRLYQMMERALLNPYQDMSLLRGHAAGLSKMFTAVQANSYEKMGKSWKSISPRHRKALRRLGMGQHIPGYVYQEPELGFESLVPESSSNTGSKTLTNVKKSGDSYWWSYDGGKTWQTGNSDPRLTP